MELKSRYGDTWELKKVNEGYIMEIPDFTRFGFFPDNEKDICFIDPPGGPFMEVSGIIGDSELITGFHMIEGENKVLINTYKKED